MAAMRGLLAIVAVVVAVVGLGAGGCGGGDPSCKDAVAKAAKLAPVKEREVSEMIGVCEQQEWPGELRRCVAGAADRDALAACMKHLPDRAKAAARDTVGDYQNRARRTEAQIQLNKLGKEATVAYVENAKFPTETAPLTPANDCCAENFEGKRKCGPSAANWSTPAWRALDFEISEPHFFRYSYLPSPDGSSFTATAVGDLDCDGVTITYTLRGTAVNGTPKTELTEPPPNSD
jgi:hypothetical protein